MTYMDHVEVIVEKEMYARDGVHKGMQGWITEPENINGYWLVNFPQCGEKNDIATIPVREEDVKVSYADSVRCMLCVASGGMPKILEENVKKSGEDSFVYR